MRVGVVAAALAGALGGTIAIGVSSRMFAARAEPPPVDSRLFYSGVLVENDQPVTGMRSIAVQLFDAPIDGSMICTSAAVPTSVQSGSFRVRLDPSCVAALDAATSKTYVQLIVDTSSVPPAGAARPQLGAVPYASQAAQSVSAATAQSMSCRGCGPQTVQHATVDFCDTNGPCTILRASSDWLTVSHTSQGNYALTFKPNTFSSVPTCVVTALKGTQAAPASGLPSFSSDIMVTGAPVLQFFRVTNTTTNSDTAFGIVCMGAN